MKLKSVKKTLPAVGNTKFLFSFPFHQGEPITMRKFWHNLPTPAEKMGLHLRGGYIFPTQQPGTTTVAR